MVRTKDLVKQDVYLESSILDPASSFENFNFVNLILLRASDFDIRI